MRKKFGFVGGNVYADRALGFASLAGEAEIEGVLHFFAAPAIANDSIPSVFVFVVFVFALGHLPEEVSAAAGGVFFFVRGAIAGAHQTTLFAAALAHAHAA